MKNAALAFTALSLVASFALVGCADDASGSEAPAADLQTISGRLDTGSKGGNDEANDGLSTKTITVTSDLHVVAHRLGKKGDANVDVDAPVAADGSFDLHLARGARYVFELERGADSVAFFGWNAAAHRANVLAIAATTKGKAAVSLGRIAVVGNGAVPEVSPTDSFDPNDTTGIDLTADWFVNAKGALLSADEALAEAAVALEQAQEALAEALSAADDAVAQATTAQEQANEALKAGQQAGKQAGKPSDSDDE